MSDYRPVPFDLSELKELFHQLLPDDLPVDSQPREPAPFWQPPGLREQAIASMGQVRQFNDTTGHSSGLPGVSAVDDGHGTHGGYPQGHAVGGANGANGYPNGSQPPMQNGYATPPPPSQGNPPLPSHEAPQFEMPRGPLGYRLRMFSEWVQQVTGASQILIADSQGYSLIEADNPDEAVRMGSALQLADALEKFRRRCQLDKNLGGIHIPIDEQNWFAVIEYQGTLGSVCMSLVTPGPLSAYGTQELTRVLAKTLEGI